MIIGVPKEIKQDEYRVAMVPSGVEELCRSGHRVVVQKGAGLGSGIDDDEYRHAGAQISPSAGAVFRKAELIVKVKEPQVCEYKRLRPGQVVFTFFHFAASAGLTRAMLRAGISAVAYETVEPEHGGLPLLRPMSEVAGRMAVHAGARCLERPHKGRGVLLSGVPGVEPAEVLIIGGGTVGISAARIAAGMGARVTILEIDPDRMYFLEDVLPVNVCTVMSNAHNLRQRLHHADLVIGAVLVTGARAPVLIRRSDLKRMKPGAVLVDVAIDQGGCFETSRPTTHQDPTYVVEGVVHYCVANMPGAVSRTATFALTNVTLPYVATIADRGLAGAAADDVGIRRGINMFEGRLTNRAVAEAFGLPWTGFPPDDAE